MKFEGVLTVMNWSRYKLLTIMIEIFSLYASFFISCLSAILIGYAYYYVHEAGHWIFGFIYNLIVYGIIAEFKITSWKDTAISFLKIPQQTSIIKGNPSFFLTFGGIFFGVFIVSIIAYMIYYRIKRKNKIFVVIIPIIFVIFEIVGNFLCGTDNYLGNGNSLVSCSDNILGIIRDYILVLLIIPAFYIIYPSVRNLLKKVMPIKTQVHQK